MKKMKIRCKLWTLRQLSGNRMNEAGHVTRVCHVTLTEVVAHHVSRQVVTGQLWSGSPPQSPATKTTLLHNVEDERSLARPRSSCDQDMVSTVDNLTVQPFSTMKLQCRGLRNLKIQRLEVELRLIVVVDRIIIIDLH